MARLIRIVRCKISDWITSDKRSWVCESFDTRRETPPSERPMGVADTESCAESVVRASTGANAGIDAGEDTGADADMGAGAGVSTCVGIGMGEEAGFGSGADV